MTGIRRISQTAANGGVLMDEAARLTPDGWDMAVTYGAYDSAFAGGRWVAGWYPTFRVPQHDEDAVIGRGDTAVDALTDLLARTGRLPR